MNMFIKPAYPGYAFILDLVCERVLRGDYQIDQRIPSVRDMATEMEVTPVTITRAYDRLIFMGVLYVQRGIGYFVSPDAPERVREDRLKRFYDEQLPKFAREVQLLGIPEHELVAKLYPPEDKAKE